MGGRRARSLVLISRAPSFFSADNDAAPNGVVTPRRGAAVTVTASWAAQLQQRAGEGAPSLFNYAILSRVCVATQAPGSPVNV